MNKELENRLRTTNADDWNMLPLTRLQKQYPILGKLDLRGLKQTHTVLPSRNFFNSDLSYWECKFSDFSRSLMSKCFVLRSDMELSTFQGAGLEFSTFVSCNFGGCQFKGADLQETTFVDCNFKGARFAGARLNWHSAPIIGEILRQNAYHRYCDRLDFAEMVANAQWNGINDWHFFRDYLCTERPDLIEWVFDTLRPYVKFDGPTFVREYIR